MQILSGKKAPLSMKKISEDGILETLNKMRLGDSEHLSSTLALKTQDTQQTREEPSCTRLNDMVRRFSWNGKLKRGTSMRGEMTERLKELQQEGKEMTKILPSMAL